MIDLFEPSSLGRLDPSHFGVWLRLPRSVGAIESPEFWGLLWDSFVNPINEQHRQFVRNAAPESALLLATCFTVGLHESRHFHDLLGTPYGSMLKRQYALATVHYLGLLPTLTTLDAIYVPLTEWVANETILTSVYNDLDPVFPSVKMIAEGYNFTMDVLDLCNRGFIGLRENTSRVSATSILEAAACLVQGAAIADNFGDIIYGAYFQSIRSSPAASRYLDPLDLIQTGFPGLSLNIQLLLLTATLCGDFNPARPGGPLLPTDLLVDLLQWLYDRGVDTHALERDHKAMELITEYFAKRHHLDFTSIPLMVASENKRAYLHFRRIAEHFAAVQGQYEGPIDAHPIYGAFLKGFRNYSDAQIDFSQQMYANFEIYGSAYYAHHRTKLEWPTTFIELEETIIVDKLFCSMFDIHMARNVYLTEEQRAEMMSEASPGEFRALLEAEKILEGERKGMYKLIDAVLIAPKKDYFRKEGILDWSLWIKNHALTGGMRLVFEGPRQGIAELAAEQEVKYFARASTKVYCSAGELKSTQFDPDQDHAETWIRFMDAIAEMKKRGAFAELHRQLRNVKIKSLEESYAHLYQFHTMDSDATSS